MRTILSLVMLAAALGADARAQAPGTPRKWAHESSDLPADPRIRFGALPSGLRYAWVHQPAGEDRSVHLRLHVDVGSLVEQESELGMAHFVEHMAFNGTKSFKAGTLIDWFQAHGVRFGHDQNASTSATETVYELDLPDAEPERLQKALAWLRDVADGLLFEEKEVQAEKGVIDAEERERNSAGLRLYLQLESNLIDGTLVQKRWPIGTKLVRAKFKSASFRAFYAKWYRPERMTLIVVGNLPDVDVEQLVKDAFGSLAPPKEAIPAKPPIGAPKVAAKAFSVFDKEEKGCTLVVAKVRPHRDEPDTVEARRRAFVREAALGAVNQRLHELSQKPGSPIDGAAFGTWGFEDLLEGPALTVACAPARWKEAFALAAAELERALTQGLAREEGQRAFQSLSEYCAVEPSAERLPMALYLGKLLAAASGGHVPVDEVAERKLMKPALSSVNAEQLSKELVAAWAEGELYLFCSGGLDLGKDAATQLKAAWEARTQPLAADSPTAAAAAGDAGSEEPVEFAYKARGATGKVAHQEFDRELQLVRIDFDNGVRVALHPTVQQNTGGAIYVRIGDGFLALDPSEAEVGWVADRVFLSSGLGEHTFAQLEKALAGNQLRFGFDVGFDACTFSGSASGDDFQRLCEVVCAFVKDAGWRPEAFADFNRDLPRLFESMDQGFSGPLSQFEWELHGKDPRFATPDRRLVESFLLDTLKEFLQPQLDEGPIELAVVAGMDPDAVMNILSRTFGILPRREAAADHAERLASPPVQPALRFRREIETAEKKVHVSVVWPTGDGIDPARRHELQFLAATLDNRVRVEIREKKGAAYSPNVRSDLSTLLSGVGCIRTDVECDPAKADEVVSACLALGDKLAREGVKPEEFAQVRTIALTQLDAAMKQDGWWLGQLARACSRPESLAEVRAPKKSFESVTIDAVNALAKQHLARARASTAVIVPKKAAPAKK